MEASRIEPKASILSIHSAVFQKLRLDGRNGEAYVSLLFCLLAIYPIFIEVLSPSHAFSMLVASVV
jgi:hypothetical protein